MPLSEVESGKTVKIVGIDGGRGIRRKLLGLGMIPGVPVKVIRKGRRSPLVLSVLNNQIMLGQRMASKVQVK